MDSFGLRDAFREEVDDLALPNLWSDKAIAAYADDAQKMFCRLTNGISDSTSALCTLDISTGEPFADLDKRILKIRRIQRDSDAHPIEIVNVEDMDALGIRLRSLQGIVRSIITGMDEHKVRWHMVPAADDTATMTVFRLPLLAITTTQRPLEIDEQHHRALLLWMKHLAYNRQDTDVYNANLSAANEAAFRAYCAAAKIEQDRARSKVRVVQYGGIGEIGRGHHGYGRHRDGRY